MKIYKIIENNDPLWRCFTGVIFMGKHFKDEEDVMINDLHPKTEEKFFCEMSKYKSKNIVSGLTSQECYKENWNRMDNGIVPYIPTKYTVVTNISTLEYKIEKYSLYPPSEIVHLEKECTIAYGEAAIYNTQNDFSRAVKNWVIYKHKCNCQLFNIEYVECFVMSQRAPKNKVIEIDGRNVRANKYWKAKIVIDATN